MKNVNRHIPMTESLKRFCLVIYMILVFPCALIITVVSIFIGPSTLTDGDTKSVMFLISAWAGVLIPVLYCIKKKNNRNKKLKQIVSLLRSEDRFSPSNHHQVFNVGHDKYLGIDSKLGTILYVHIVKKDVIDVIGLTMRDWTDRELQGSILRIYTRMPDMPVLSLSMNKSKDIFDMLGAMSHKNYSEPYPNEPWSLYVKRQSKLVQFEHDVVVPQAI
ncbi:plasmid IncI1-type surface exclusion protein ExcA [Pectobacterium parvum]|uniref:plasmid IncI1-type surface exclusion protein ExcA n=1 Tax=Pectobacterium parvum TaxID=2778550 RepID=UPI000DCFB23A|nr:plasmid IncI1-type surface exclusion protein ExcA [Pectobacterium parvum]